MNCFQFERTEEFNINTEEKNTSAVNEFPNWTDE